MVNPCYAYVVGSENHPLAMILQSQTGSEIIGPTYQYVFRISWYSINLQIEDRSLVIIQVLVITIHSRMYLWRPFPMHFVMPFN